MTKSEDGSGGSQQEARRGPASGRRREHALTRLCGKTVGVVYGPSSVEDRTYSEALPREQWSASQIVAALTAVGVEARIVDPTSADLVRDLSSCDLVFVNSHGRFGEDGRLQGLPGMQQTSNLPEAARRAGLDYVDLVLTLLTTALDASDRGARERAR